MFYGRGLKFISRLRVTNSYKTDIISCRLNTLKGTAIDPAVDIISCRLNTLKSTKKDRAVHMLRLNTLSEVFEEYH